MTRQRQVLIGLGAFLIVALLVVAAFALGIYVGQHGWTREGLALNGPRRPGPPAPDRPGDPPGPGQPGLPLGQPLPGGQPTLVGRVRDVFDHRLQLATSDGPRTVILSSDTRVEDREGRLVGLEALHKGQDVALFGRIGGDGRTLEVDLVILLPPPDQRPPPQQPRP